MGTHLNTGHGNALTLSADVGSPFYIHRGDALGVLRTLPDESVDCCVTSPPYFHVRDYRLKTGRRYVGIELNQDYIDLSYERTRKYYPLLMEASA